MPVGQESPTRGMGVWPVAGRASSMIEQSRYLVMAISPGWYLVSICEVEEFWLGARNFREYAQWHSAKIAKIRFWPFWPYQCGGCLGFDVVSGAVCGEFLISNIGLLCPKTTSAFHLWADCF